MEKSSSTTKQRPVILNTIHPCKLFTENEIKQIEECVERYKRKTYGKKVRIVSEKEKVTIGDLLRRARFQGYFADGIDVNGEIIWCRMYEPYLPKLGKHCVITIIQACKECSVNFHAYHYQGEQPSDLCKKCRENKN